MRKIAIAVLMAFIFIFLLVVPALADPSAAIAAMPAGTATPRDWEKYAPDGTLVPDKIEAESAILMDNLTGKVLFEKDADTRRYPASITKIMTCLLTLESGHDLSEIVTVGELPALPSDASDIDLIKGEQLTIEDLLYGLMLISGNDAANALAVHLKGSVGEFVAEMNSKAQEIGMTGTHFVNPNGMHDDDHYSTARDMALLAIAARKYPELVKIVKTTSYTMAATNKHSDSRVWKGHVKLVNSSDSNPYSYIYATGMKTGFTNPAMYTLVSSAEKDSMQLVAVVLKDGQTAMWTDSITMFEYGFNFYDTVDLQELLAGQTISTQIKNSAGSDEFQGNLDLIMKPQAKAYITDSKDEIEKIKNNTALFEQRLDITKDTAPITKDDVVGTITFLYGGNPVMVCDLWASRDVDEMPTAAPEESALGAETALSSAAPGSTGPAGEATAPPKDTAAGGVGSVFIWLGIILLLLILAALTIRFVNMQRRNKKHRQYNFRQRSRRR